LAIYNYLPTYDCGNSQKRGEETLMLPHMHSPIPLSGVPAMDKLHHDLFVTLDELSCADDRTFPEHYGILVHKVERVFRTEEQWMEATDFPGLRSHQEQHARVLGGLHNVHSRVMNGEIGVGREVAARLLPQWLTFHVSTMDAVLALAMQMSSTPPASETSPLAS
jgi:hemerythrin-like metal-binding protein